MQRSAMRELAFKLVYGIEIQKVIEESQVDLFIEANEITDNKVTDYLKDITAGLSEHVYGRLC